MIDLKYDEEEKILKTSFFEESLVFEWQFFIFVCVDFHLREKFFGQGTISPAIHHLFVLFQALWLNSTENFVLDIQNKIKIVL